MTTGSTRASSMFDVWSATTPSYIRPQKILDTEGALSFHAQYGMGRSTSAAPAG